LRIHEWRGNGGDWATRHRYLFNFKTAPPAFVEVDPWSVGLKAVVDALRIPIVRELGYRFYDRDSGRACPPEQKSSSQNDKAYNGGQPDGFAA
jgi:hypothetical protein